MNKDLISACMEYQIHFILDIKTVHDKYGNTLRKMYTSTGLVALLV